MCGLFPLEVARTLCVRRRVGDLFADIHESAVDEDLCGAVHQAINERSVRVLKNWRNLAGQSNRS